jgi:hypothetical protein
MKPIIASLLLAGLLVAAAPARADVIDGSWCSPDGLRSLTIDGPRIVTPGGTSLQGMYDRHAFSYVVPQKEEGAGSTTQLRLVNETTMQYSRGDKQAPAEVWRRCSRPVS